MSSRHTNPTQTPRCTFAYKDGRHCTLPAHPKFDGLCYSHGTFSRRASRQDNLLRVLQPLANGRSSARARNRALRALSRAMCEGSLSPERVGAITKLTVLVDQCARFADQQSFTSTTHPAWARLRQAVDDLDSYRDKKKT